jgi:cystathionine beta-lyase
MGNISDAPTRTHEWDRISPSDLRARGISKWTQTAQDELGGFVAEEDFGTPECVVNAMHDVVERQSFGYVPLAVADDACSAFAGFAARRYGWRFSPADVRVVPDVISALEYSIFLFTSPGQKVVVPTPAYMPFLQVPGRLGRDVIELPMSDVATAPRLDLEHLEHVLESQDVGLLVLCNPHNPTGHVMSAQEHSGLDAVLERHPHVRVFSDEIHAPVTLAGARHLPYAAHSSAAAGRTVTATSTSKCFGMPGLRSAQVVLTNPQDAAAWERLGDRPLRLASTPGLYATVAAYTDADAWLEEFLDYLSVERDELAQLVEQELPLARMHRPAATYICLLDFGAYDLPCSPAQFFRERAGVVLTDGAACGTGFEDSARLVWATPRPVLREMMARMGAALREQTRLS